ncbi:uncharacterized protein LTR77_004798 [Saxophila tyrrhenica]|uniref:Coatomer subunit epsilon n=1 Tax=Saxophila tyrrhenica TaxID=1690608 RepID=A0AAV9PDK7_9PEZI|nr:hypothetical protein LTR77_004798 [Saxophila tyrrhenica]
MDPFSSDGELVHIHTAFTQSQHSTVLSDFDPSSFSASNRLPVQVLQYRAQCALGQNDDVISSISDADAKSTPDLAAVRVYASYLQSVAQGSGGEDAVAEAERSDLAVKEAKSARSFAQDALLVNLAESWIGMRKGGEEYQKAFYVFEELAQSPSSASAASLVSQAVSELHMGRVEEAETALNSALGMEPDNTAALANKLVLDTILGRDAGEARKKLESTDAQNEMLEDFKAKREAFRTAMGKYSPKFEP